MRNRLKPHLKSSHPLYERWIQMRARCTKPYATNYKNYGGRGIKVCDRWFNSFENYVTDVGLQPAPGMSLDRINNDGNYEPSNLRWATAAQQSINQRKSSLNTTGYKGVSWNKSAKKYEAFITVKGKHIYLGRYSNKREAARIYDEQALFYYGKDAVLNFKY